MAHPVGVKLEVRFQVGFITDPCDGTMRYILGGILGGLGCAQLRPRLWIDLRLLQIEICAQLDADLEVVEGTGSKQM